MSDLTKELRRVQVLSLESLRREVPAETPRDRKVHAVDARDPALIRQSSPSLIVLFPIAHLHASARITTLEPAQCAKPYIHKLWQL